MESTGIDHFAHLPDLLFQQILQHLSIADRTRLKILNQNWHRQCSQSIKSKPGMIDFGDPNLLQMPENQLVELLSPGRFQSVIFNIHHPQGILPLDRMVLVAATFAQFQYPKLTTMEIDWRLNISPEKSQFFQHVRVMLSRCCPALESLKINRVEEETFDFSTITNISVHLGILELDNYHTSPKFFNWLGNHCKNLVTLIAEILKQPTVPVEAYVQEMGYCFQNCRKLTCIADLVPRAVQLPPPYIPEILQDVSQFWSLPHLTGISFLDPLDDNFIDRLVRSFPKLQILAMCMGEHTTNTGISRLAELSDLHDFVISDVFLTNPLNSIAASISKTAAKGKLVIFSAIRCNLDNWACILQIIRKCPKITKLHVSSDPLIHPMPPRLMVDDLIGSIETNLPMLNATELPEYDDNGNLISDMLHLESNE